MDFTGKVVLITGASSGIGAATAVYLSSFNADLSLTGRNEANLKKTVESCRKGNSKNKLFSVVGDMSKEEDVENIVKQTIAKFGRLDVLVNNAAFALFGPLETITLDIYDSIFNTNVRGVVLLTKLAMPHLIESKGNVVNISSVAGLRPGTISLAYCMSKAALDQFTKCVALEVASKQVRVNSVNPGPVKTDFANRMGIKDGDPVLELFAKTNPMGRFAYAKEIATAIAFLASDLASNITGVLLSVDGGQVIAPPQ